MANFTSADVMKLREQTGVGMMDCKKALVATDGNFDEAIKFLREKGMASAAKKQSRVAAEGLVKCYINDDKTVGVCVEVNCETDFVARSDQFIALVDNIAKHIAQSNAQTAEEVLAEAFYADNSKTIADLVAEATAQIGEKISLRRFTKYVLDGEGIIASYIHMGGTIGVMTEVKKPLCKSLHSTSACKLPQANRKLSTLPTLTQANLTANAKSLPHKLKTKASPKPSLQRWWKDVSTSSTRKFASSSKSMFVTAASA